MPNKRQKKKNRRGQMKRMLSIMASTEPSSAEYRAAEASYRTLASIDNETRITKSNCRRNSALIRITLASGAAAFVADRRGDIMQTTNISRFFEGAKKLLEHFSEIKMPWKT